MPHSFRGGDHEIQRISPVLFVPDLSLTFNPPGSVLEDGGAGSLGDYLVSAGCVVEVGSKSAAREPFLGIREELAVEDGIAYYGESARNAVGGSKFIDTLAFNGLTVGSNENAS